MASADRFRLAQRAMFTAPGHALVEALAEVLREHYDVSRCDLLLADYCLTVLRPVTAAGPDIPVTGSPEGRVFAEQQAVEVDADAGVRLLLPVTVRGDRMGVFALDRPAPADRATASELADLAVALAHDLRTADDVTDRYRQARRRTRLTVAAEMQWHLLPGRSLRQPEFELAGQLEPAYTVCGDNFDWSSGADHLVLTVTNGHGEGVDAALLTALAVNAMRNARFTGGSLADQACLADQAVYAQYRGVRHLSTLLLRFDLTSGAVAVVDAGSPLLVRVRADRVERIDLEAQLPLGMFESTDYVEQALRMRPGDRLVVLSDGVHDVAYGGQRYRGQGRLRQTLLRTRGLPPGEVVRAVLADHGVFRQGAPLADDAAVVCLDWSGPAAP